MREEEFIKYLKRGFIVFTLKLMYDHANKKKRIYPPKGYNEFTRHETYYDEGSYGIAIRTGKEYNKGRYLILIDIDNKEEGIVENGMRLWERWEGEDKMIGETVKERTPSGGYHYYYYVDEEQRKYIGSSKTQIEYEKKRYAVDYKFKNQCAIMSPSYYYKNGIKCEYKWEGKDILSGSIRKLPEVIYRTIKEEPKKEKGEYKNRKDNVEYDDEFKKSCEVGEIERYMRYIRCDDKYEKWRDIGYILKNLNTESYKIYDEWSKGGDKYSKNDVERFWKYHKANNKIRIRALRKYVKEDKMEGYREIIGDEEEERIYKPIEVQERYISNSDKKIHKPNNKKENVNNIVYKWMMSGEKFLSIKSPYDTGKTTLIKSILNTFPEETKSVLYITYRQTLARNISATFEEYKFVNYLDNRFGGDRQIIQLDSIWKVPIDYDVVIIDEIESVIAHLTSKTIMNKSYNNSEMIYKYTGEIIERAKKVLSLDGDYGNRSHTYLSEFGEEVKVVENTIKFGEKEFVEYRNEINFKNEIHRDINRGKKLVICCMAASTVNEYYEILTTYYPGANIIKYTSKTDDEQKKEDFENVQITWSVDVLIYSPTIESGVDYNVENFDKLYVIYSRFSTCPRGLNQMMNRVRKFKEKEVGILLKNASASEEMTINVEDIRENYMAISKREELTGYDLMYCYNMKEKNDSDSNFYNVFMKMIKEKGHKMRKAEKIEEEPEVKEIKKTTEIERIISSKKINGQEYNELLKKQQKNEATEEEKYMIERHTYEVVFGIEKIDEEFMKKYYKKLDIIKKHKGLLKDEEIEEYYFKNDDNYDVNKTILKIEKVRQIIKAIGYKDCYDKKEIKRAEFEKNIKEAMRIVKDYHKINNKQIEIRDTNKGMIGAVNTILHEYGVEIVFNGKPVKINKQLKKIEGYKIRPKDGIDKYVTNK